MRFKLSYKKDSLIKGYFQITGNKGRKKKPSRNIYKDEYKPSRSGNSDKDSNYGSMREILNNINKKSNPSDKKDFGNTPGVGTPLEDLGTRSTFERNRLILYYPPDLTTKSLNFHKARIQGYIGMKTYIIKLVPSGIRITASEDELEPI